MTEQKIVERMRKISKEALAIGPWLKGNLLRGKKNKYTKKDGTISVYVAPAILQYRVAAGAKGRHSKRIPVSRLEEIQGLLEAGNEYTKLMEEYAGLAAVLALSVKKKA
jgi:hypothetical protein